MKSLTVLGLKKIHRTSRALVKRMAASIVIEVKSLEILKLIRVKIIDKNQNT